MLSFISAAVDGAQWEKRALFSVINPYLSPPSTRLHLALHVFIHEHLSLSLSLLLSLFLHRLLPIITCSPSPSPLEETQWVTQSQLKPHSGHFLSAFPSFLASFLSSVIVCSYEYHSLHCCLSGLQCLSSKPDLTTSCYLSFSLVSALNFLCETQRLQLSVISCFYVFLFSTSLFETCPQFFLWSISPPFPSSPNHLPLSPSGYGWVRSICGQRPSQPERWAEMAKWHLPSGSICQYQSSNSGNLCLPVCTWLVYWEPLIPSASQLTYVLFRTQGGTVLNLLPFGHAICSILINVRQQLILQFGLSFTKLCYFKF